MISVQLACTPPILNAVLTPLLAELPDVAIACPMSEMPDVVVTSTCVGSDTPLDWLKPPRRGPTIIALDALTNTLRVRLANHKAPRERTLPGTLANLLHVLQELSQADSHELTPAGSKTTSQAHLSHASLPLKLPDNNKHARDASALKLA